jgi:hypothetical protein
MGRAGADSVRVTRPAGSPYLKQRAVALAGPGGVDLSGLNEKPGNS